MYSEVAGQVSLSEASLLMAALDADLDDRVTLADIKQVRVTWGRMGTGAVLGEVIPRYVQLGGCCAPVPNPFGGGTAISRYI